MSDSPGQFHTVERGESLSLIGRRLRIPWKKIWEHAENAELRKKRGNPNILHPGDRLYIPDLKVHEVDCAPNRSHKFRTSGAVWIRIAVVGLDHKPVSGVAYRFLFDDIKQPERKTNGKGIAEAELPSGVRDVQLRLPWATLPVRVAELAPAHTIRGIQQRLQNLGFDPGSIDGIDGPDTARAISEFQVQEGIPVTGKPDQELIRRLRSVHERETLDGKCEQLETHPEEGNDVPDREAADVSMDDPDLD